MICITISSPKTSHIQYTRLPSIYQYMVNLVVSLTIREVQVYLWMFRWGNIVLLTTRFCDVAKLTSLTPLSLLSWWRLSCPIVGLKLFSLPTFALQSPSNIFIWYTATETLEIKHSSPSLQIWHAPYVYFQNSGRFAVRVCVCILYWRFERDQIRALDYPEEAGTKLL